LFDPALVCRNETGSNLTRTAKRNSPAKKTLENHRKFANLLFVQ